VTQATW